MKYLHLFCKSFIVTVLIHDIHGDSFLQGKGTRKEYE